MTEEVPRPGERTLQALREKILDVALAVLGWGMPVVALLILVQTRLAGARDALTWAQSAFTLAFPVLRLARRWLGFRPTTLVLLALTLLAAVIIETRGGLAFGPALLNLILVQIAGLFFGRRAAIYAFVAVLVTMAISAAVVTMGIAPPPSPDMWDSRLVGPWIREGLVFAVLGGTIAIAIMFVFGNLEAEVDSLHAALTREAAERQAREVAETDRQRADTAAQEARIALLNGQRLEALGRLAGGIAHDFNNALFVISAAATVLKEDPGLGPRSRTMVADLEGAAQGAAQLTKQLLTLGRRDVARPEVVAIDSLITRIAASARRAMPGDFEIVVETHADRAIRIDPLQFERAFLNLLLNARDAMPTGGQVTVSTAVEAAPTGLRVVVRVRDCGVGMDQVTRERIFEPFFTSKATGEGTGLGLALVQTIVEEAGGSIAVESATGKGTTVSLSFPECVEAAGVLQGGAGSRPAMVREDGVRKGYVAVVEDREDVRRAIVGTLARDGYTVVEATDGDDAMRLFDDPDLRMDLLCIDAVMPGAGTAAVIARFLEQKPQAKVLVVSGHIEEEMLRRGIVAGHYAFLAKPFLLDELRDRVRGLMAEPPSSLS